MSSATSFSQSGRKVDDDSVPLRKNSASPVYAGPRELGEPQLNFDVLYLLFFACHPRDLLSFARTCKSIRRTLMSRSSAFIWKAARRQVKGIPACPSDLSEPAYAHLAFYPYCHGCGGQKSQIFWRMRRRYCKRCKHKRFFPRNTWDTVRMVGEDVKNDGPWVDKDHINLWMEEYQNSSDQKEFLTKKKKQYGEIAHHAVECDQWMAEMASERKDELTTCLRKRDKGILDRLMQLGYQREIYYFGRDYFRDSNRKKSLKRAPKPLTDREWDRILPWWLRTMSRCRQARLSRVYRPRREALKSGFDRYVERRFPGTLNLDLFPRVGELACFPPFRDILYAPEETTLGRDPFAPAFSQLPALVDDWREKLETELTSLVTVPPGLISGDTYSGMASKDEKCTEGSQTCSNKLQLACAVFQCGSDVLAYPEIFSVATNHHLTEWRTDELSRSLYDRFSIRFLHEAPYIIHACGLDPNVATPDDMDRRDARLWCLYCSKDNLLIMSWRDAMVHARGHSQLELLSASPRWQLVSDEYMNMIRAPKSIECEPLSRKRVRCLLCLPCVGDARWEDQIDFHLHCVHNVKKEDIQHGVHFARIDFRALPALVGDWKKQLETELTDFVKIPLDLVSRDAYSGVVSTDKRIAEGSQTCSNKLQLACAVFQRGSDVLAYPEILSVATNDHLTEWRTEELSKSLYDRFSIKFLHEAPYIIHACGLDPNVATPSDMDRRDARLRCLFCKENILIMNWRDAMVHSRGHSQSELVSTSPRWQLIDDEYMNMIRAAEAIESEPPSRKRVRCLLCLPRVGDVRWEDEVDFHLHRVHNVKKEDVRRGVHFAHIDLRDGPSNLVR